MNAAELRGTGPRPVRILAEAEIERLRLENEILKHAARRNELIGPERSTLRLPVLSHRPNDRR